MARDPAEYTRLANSTVIDKEAPNVSRFLRQSRSDSYEEGNHLCLPFEFRKSLVETNTPHCGGRIPLLLHLLAPNMRPQQITDDLASLGQYLRRSP